MIIKQTQLSSNSKTFLCRQRRERIFFLSCNSVNYILSVMRTETTGFLLLKYKMKKDVLLINLNKGVVNNVTHIH